MRRLLLLILAVLLIIVSLSSCGEDVHTAKIDVKILCKNETQLNRDESSFSIEPPKAPADKKIIVLLCSFTNAEKYTVDCFDIESSNNEAIITKSGYLDWDPPMPISSGDEKGCYLYAFVDKDLTEEQIEEELKKTTFTFSCFNEDHLNHGAKMYFYGTI